MLSKEYSVDRMISILHPVNKSSLSLTQFSNSPNMNSLSSNMSPLSSPRSSASISGNESQPLFLRKAFYMISNCPQDIAGWAEDGQSFIVRDVDRFAGEVIPTVYKHNKFSSFVRQLNFYGFRKVRSELYHTNISEFRHPHFRRGDINGLSKIKKSGQEIPNTNNSDDNSSNHSNSNNNGNISPSNNGVNNNVVNNFEIIPESAKEEIVQLHQRIEYLDSHINELNKTLDYYKSLRLNQINNNNEFHHHHHFDHHHHHLENLSNEESGEVKNEDNNNSLEMKKRKIMEENETVDFWEIMELDDEAIKFNMEENYNNNSNKKNRSEEALFENIKINEVSEVSEIIKILPSHLAERFVDKLAFSINNKINDNNNNGNNNGKFETFIKLEKDNIKNEKELVSSNNNNLMPSNCGLVYPLASAAIGAFINGYLS